MTHFLFATFFTWNSTIFEKLRFTVICYAKKYGKNPATISYDVIFHPDRAMGSLIIDVIYVSFIIFALLTISMIANT